MVKVFAGPILIVLMLFGCNPQNDSSIQIKRDTLLLKNSSSILTWVLKSGSAQIDGRTTLDSAFLYLETDSIHTQFADLVIFPDTSLSTSLSNEKDSLLLVSYLNYLGSRFAMEFPDGLILKSIDSSVIRTTQTEFRVPLEIPILVERDSLIIISGRSKWEDAVLIDAIKSENNDSESLDSIFLSVGLRLIFENFTSKNPE